MNNHSRAERKQQVKFAVGMASIDGGRPSGFTNNLLNQYENGEVSIQQVKKAIMDKYIQDVQ